MLRRLLFIVLGLFSVSCVTAPPPARAQDTATLRIVVTSTADGNPLEGANVQLRPPDAKTNVRAGATNRDGYLAFRGLAPRRYRIAISYVGYKTHRDTVSLKAGRRIYSAALTPRPERLEEVTVEARPGLAQRQAGRQTIEPAALGRIPTPGPSGDLASYLQTLPGVVSVGDRGGQLYIQGGAPTQNRYLIDGLPVVRPFHISSFYSAFPQNIIQSVDLYAGGFGAEYGEALSSVLDVRLRPGNMKRYTGSAAVGPHLAAIHAEGPLVRGEQSFLVSARYSLLEQTAPLWGQNARIGFYDVTGRYTFQRENATCNVTALRTHDQGSIGASEDRVLTWSNTVIGGRCFFLDEQLNQTFSVRGGYSGFHNTAGTKGNPEQEAGRWRAYIMLNGDQTLLGYPVDFGGRLTLGRYRARLASPFVGVDEISDTQGMVRAHWSLDWAPSDYLTVVPSLAVRATYSVRLSADPRVRLSFRPTGTEQQEISFAAGVYRQIDEGISDQRDAGTVFTVWKPPALEDPLPSALQALLGYRYRLGSSLEASIEGYAKQ
ncbi:MAG: carboxypeptidase regulatory-like domain-containing protein, partial [Salinibacter sp.]